MKKITLSCIAALFASNAVAWEANVTDVLQHYNYVAVYLSPDPGPGNCQYGQPYLLVVDDTAASKQRFAMIMAALTTGNKIIGYLDPCATAIWSQSRPTIERLVVRAN